MALKLNCLENLTAIGIGVGACALAPFDAGLTAGAVIGGAGLFARIRENMRKAGLDDKAAVERMQKAILREWDHWQSTQEFRDAVTEADAAMTRSLPQLMMTREALAATATKSPDAAYPKAAARAVVDELAKHDAMFAPPATDDAKPSLARSFALEVIERALRAAKEDKDYAVLLTLDITIELGRAIAETQQAIRELGDRIDAGIAAVLKSRGEFERVSTQALRGAVARFVVFKPDATTSEVVSAVYDFVPQYEQLRSRIAALEAADNRLKGAQQAAEHALDQGDLDAARRHLGEAADIQVERLAEPVRQTAATIDELARADLLALDWQSADANWTRTGMMLEPFDPDAAANSAEVAAAMLARHGERFARAPAIEAAVRRWRDLIKRAARRGELVRWATAQNELGFALRTLGERTEGSAGLALLSKAAQAYEAAHTVFTENAMPEDWAMVHNNLGNVLSIQGERQSGKNSLAFLAQGAAAYRSALKVYTKGAMPTDWAMTQNNLGNVLSAQGERTPGKAGLTLLAEGGGAYRAALTVYSMVRDPINWSMTWNNLGTLLWTQGSRTRAKAGLALMREAIEAYRFALTVRTEATMPAKWAITSYNMAVCYEGIARRVAAPLADLRAAEEALVGALRIFTPEHAGHFHNRAKSVLAKVQETIMRLEG